MSDQFKSSAPRPVDDYVAGWLAVSIALIALIIVGQALWSSAVKAAPIDMECLDPHRTYHVIFDPEAKTFVTETVKDGTTSFVVQSVETPNSSFVVYGNTVEGGPAFVAHFDDDKRIELYDAGKKFQTDSCR